MRHGQSRVTLVSMNRRPHRGCRRCPGCAARSEIDSVAHGWIVAHAGKLLRPSNVGSRSTEWPPSLPNRALQVISNAI
jgi:hypothetical protein